METQFKFLSFSRKEYKRENDLQVYSHFFIFFLYIQHRVQIMTLKALMRLSILFHFTLMGNSLESGVVEGLKILFKEIKRPLQPVAVICWSVGLYTIKFSLKALKCLVR